MGEGNLGLQLKSSVGIKAVIIVALVAIAHQWYQMTYPDDEVMTITTFSFGASAAVAAIAAFFVGRRYWGSEIFGKTYVSLAIGMMFLAAGDGLYVYYDWFTDEAPYPSLADVFFLLFYPFAIYHLVSNIRYFKKDLRWGPKIGVGATAIAFVGLFAMISLVNTETGQVSFELDEEDQFDFFFGLVYVAGSGIVFGLGLLGVSVFRESILGTAWLILASGLFIFSLADVWYYYLEIVDGYSTAHFVNTLWVLSHTLIVYGLYKHKKTI